MPGNYLYNCNNSEMEIKTNEAYHTVTSDVITSTNPAYVTTASVSPNGHSEPASRESGTEDIATSTNVAYERTDPTTSDNPAYLPTCPHRRVVMILWSMLYLSSIVIYNERRRGSSSTHARTYAERIANHLPMTMLLVSLLLTLIAVHPGESSVQTANTTTS